MDSARRPRLRVAFAYDQALMPDLMGPEQWQALGEVAAVLDHSPLRDFASAQAGRVLAEADCLVTGWGCPRIDAAALAAAPNLCLVAHTGSTVKPIVSDALWGQGALVVSAAAANAVPVAEFTLAAILFANKGAFRAARAYAAAGRPERYPWTAPGERGSYRARIGIVGASRIGRAVIGLLQAFDVEILVSDPLVSADEIAAIGGRLVPLEAMAPRCDVLSIHAPLLPATTGLIDARILASLRDGATVINTARGPIVDAAALEVELVSGRLSAVLDVTHPEPLPPTSPLLALPNVFVTPHIAGAAGHETRRMADLAIAEIGRFARGEPLLHAIRRDMLAVIG